MFLRGAKNLQRKAWTLEKSELHIYLAAAEGVLPQFDRGKTIALMYQHGQCQSVYKG